MASTVGDMFKAAVARLAAVGQPASDVEELLSRLLDVGRGDLRRLASSPCPSETAARFDAWLARRIAGEPVQYVTGRAAFRDLDLLVDPRVLIPRPETEQVAERAIAAARSALGRSQGGTDLLVCADLGTGSGGIGLSLLAELPRGSATVWLTDISSDALDVARANGTGLGMAGAGARYAQGSWFDALPSELCGALDLVVSNPPYIAVGDPEVDANVVARARETPDSGDLRG